MLGWQKFILFLSLLVLLVACGGGDDSGSNSNSNSNAGGDNQNPPDAQPTEAPTSGPALAAQVNDTPITLEHFQQEVTANLAAVGDQQPADATAFETEILELMIDQVLLEQYAAANNIIVTAEMVQAELQILNEMATESGSSVEAIFVGYPPEMIEQKVRENLLWQAVSEAVTADVPTTTTQIHARHILVKDEEMGRYILEQLAAGSDFAQLALEFSKDGSTTSAGGDLGWFAQGDLLQPEVEAVLFQMPANSRWPDPVASSLGYHVVEVLEIVEDRPIDPQRRTERQEQIFEDWLQSQRASAQIVRYEGNNPSQ